MKRKFIVNIWSSKEDLKLFANDIQYEIYENISDLDTVEVKEVPIIEHPFYEKIKQILTNLEIYDNEDDIIALTNQLSNLYINYPRGMTEVELKYPYKDLENIPDSTKGDCSNCSAGLLSIDLEKSLEDKECFNREWKEYI